MSVGERTRRINDFKAGRLRFLFNAMVLTTGFDYPGIDCLMMLRPTQSIGLYVQIMGRGLRNVYAPGFDLNTDEGRLAAADQVVLQGGRAPRQRQQVLRRIHAEIAEKHLHTYTYI